MFFVTVLSSTYIYMFFFIILFYLRWSAVLIVGVVVRYNVVRSLNVNIYVDRLDRS